MLQDKCLCALVINALFVKVLLGFPRTVVEISGCAAWIQLLFDTAIALMVFFIIMRISNRDKNIIEIISVKWLRVITGIAVIAVLFVNLIQVVRIFPDEVKISMLQETDQKIIIAVLVLVSAAGAYFGISAIGRATALFFPVMTIIFLISTLLLIPKYDIENLFPIFGTGSKNIFTGGFSTFSLFSDLIVLNLLIPYAKNMRSVKRCGAAAIIISGAGAAVTLLVYCLTFTYPISKEFVIPLYNMARLINITSFFNRFEAFYEFAWTILVLLYISMYIYIICCTAKTSFYLKSIRRSIPAAAVILFIFAVVPDDIRLFDSIWKYSYIAVLMLMIVFGRKWRTEKI